MPPRPEQAQPDQTGSGHPDQTKPDQAMPDWTGPGQAELDRSMAAGLRLESESIAQLAPACLSAMRWILLVSPTILLPRGPACSPHGGLNFLAEFCRPSLWWPGENQPTMQVVDCTAGCVLLHSARKLKFPRLPSFRLFACRLAAMAQVISFDITIPVSEANKDHVLVGKKLAEIAKKFAFQKEQGDNGYVHYQVRLQVWKRTSLAKMIKDHGGAGLWNGHISVTSSATHSNRNFNYVMKADSRLS